MSDLDLELALIATFSMGHMTAAEGLAFADGEAPVNRTVWSCEYGYMFWIEDHNEIDLDALSPGLRMCIEVAAEADCKFIRFDRDADTTPGIPHYDW